MSKQERKQQDMTNGRSTTMKEPMLGMVKSPVQTTQMSVTGCQMKILVGHWLPWLPVKWTRHRMMVLKSLVRLVNTNCRPLQLWIVPKEKDPSRDQEKARTRAKERAREL